MINNRNIELDFTERLGWHKVDNLPGNFSVTPDVGKDLLRVFSADIKIRQFGRSLLGIVGFHSLRSDYPFADRLGISVYITNFDSLSVVPILKSTSEVSIWVDQIASTVLSLPSNEKKLIESIRLKKIGPFDLEIFASSTPWFREFILWMGEQ